MNLVPGVQEVILGHVVLFLLHMVCHLDVGLHRNNTTLVPNSLEDICLLSIILFKLNVLWLRHLSQLIIIVVNGDLNLLEHVSYDKDDHFGIIVAARREVMIYELNLTVATRVVIWLDFLNDYLIVLFLWRWDHSAWF